jgi:hypothetical protein
MEDIIKLFNKLTLNATLTLDEISYFQIVVLRIQFEFYILIHFTLALRWALGVKVEHKNIPFRGEYKKIAVTI